MEFTFETEIEVCFADEPIKAEVTYQAKPERIEKKYFSRLGYEIEVTKTEYDTEVNGEEWKKLERICQRKAEKHFFERSVA